MSPRIAPGFWRIALLRATMFLALWLVLTLGNGADLPAGIVAAIAATWVSVYLLTPSDVDLSLPAILKFVLHFFYQSVVAGVDVARRALDPRLPLQPGYVSFPCRLSQGPARSTFCTLASLLPGTVPVTANDSGVVLVHCLDVSQPVVAQLTEDEHLFRRALGEERGDG
jgi:multicomponent Na+:H+ antiporter subunit E